MDEIFNPGSIAVVGASPDPSKAGYQFFKGLVDLKFDGDIYPINLEGSDVLGFKGYRNLRDVPGPLDYVTVAIPVHEVPKIIEDCVAKGVKAFTSHGNNYDGGSLQYREDKRHSEIPRRHQKRIAENEA